jgi:hypothetical protein
MKPQLQQKGLKHFGNGPRVTRAIGPLYPIRFPPLGKGRVRVGSKDMLIAATAIVKGLTLVSNDSDLLKVEGLN